MAAIKKYLSQEFKNNTKLLLIKLRLLEVGHSFSTVHSLKKSLTTALSSSNIDQFLNVLVDESKYYIDHPDVIDSGMGALEHFIAFGYSEGREACPNFSAPASFLTINKENGKTILCSSAPSDDGSFLYRCVYRQSEYPNSELINIESSLQSVLLSLLTSETLIFSRPEYGSQAKYILSLAKFLGLKVILDYDDLLLPELAQYLGHVRSKKSDLGPTRKNLLGKTAFFRYADAFICSTPQVAEYFEVYGKPVILKRNRLPNTMLIPESLLDANKAKRPLKVKLLYLSGTATHKRDYSLIHGVLLKLAARYPDKFELTFLGSTGVNIEAFSILGLTVNTIPKLTWDEMLRIIREHDVGLVPLELTIFNQAKSNIKFLECASQAVPVVASSVSEFKNIITHSINGWLCESPLEFYNTLESIVCDSSNVRKTGMEAFNTLKKEYLVEGD